MSDACQDFFTQNTDISGIGVRTAFYAQAGILVFQVLLLPKKLSGAFWTLSAMVWGLIIAGLITAAQNQLTFFNAVAISNLVWFANQGLYLVYAVAGLESKPKRRLEGRLLTIIFITGFFAGGGLTIYYWAIVQRFGPNPECSPLTHFYLIGWNASNKISFKTIRTLAIVWYTIATVTIVHVLVYRTPMAKGVFDEVAGTIDPKHGKHHEKGYNFGWRIITWLFSGWVFTMLSVIPSLELFLRQRPQPDNVGTQWSFGQILALISILPSLVQVLTALASRLTSTKGNTGRPTDQQEYVHPTANYHGVSQTDHTGYYSGNAYYFGGQY